MNLEKRFGKCLDTLEIPQGCRILIALSGGGDSVSLLELLVREREKRRWDLYASRVVHGIRTLSEEDEENRLCRRLCRERDVPFAVLNAVSEIRTLEEHLGCGPEQAARTARHRILDDYADKIAAKAVFFGHTADDQLETVMMRLLSGSGPEGLKGISASTGRSFRPLLSVERRELRRFLSEAGIPWAEDSTNEGSRYVRNRVRNELLPLITDIFPGWPSSLHVLSERAEEVSDALSRSMDMELPSLQKDKRYCWNPAQWDASPEYFRAMAIWDAVNRFDDSELPDRRYPWKSVKAVRNALRKSGKWTFGGITAERNEHSLEIRRTGEHLEGRLIVTQDEARNGFEAVFRGLRILIAPKEPETGTSIKKEILKVTEWPLIIRFAADTADSVQIQNIITEKSSVPKFADADKEIFYILIDRKPLEGNDA